MQDRSEEEQLWDLLAQEGEEESQAVAPRVSELSQSPTFLDRVTQRLASGVLPLFLAGMGSVLPFAMMGEWKGIAVGLLGLLSLAWLLAPLVRSRGFTSATRLALLFVPLTLLSVSVAILPNQILDQADLVLTGVLYQYALEAVLGGYGFFLFIGTLFLVGLPAYMMGKSRPWTRVQPAGTVRKVAAALTILAPVMIYGALWRSSAASTEELTWRTSVEPLLAQAMPRGGAPWHELYTTYNLIMLGKEPSQVEPLNDLVKKMVLQIEQGLPKTVAEASSVDYLVEGLLKDSRLQFDADTRAELAYLQTHARLVSRPRYQYLQSLEELDASILPTLLESPDISKWELRMQALEQLLPATEMAELDMNAASFFYRDTFEQPEVFGKVVGQENRRKVYLNPLRQLQERKPSKAEPLKILGQEFQGSPSQLVARWFRSKEVEAWLSLRRELEPLEPAERLSRIQALQARRTNNLSQSFLEDLAGRSYAFSLRPWLETAQVILKLQKQRKQGSVPSLSPEEMQRWSLEKNDSGWLLTDKVLKESGQARTWSRPLK